MKLKTLREILFTTLKNLFIIYFILNHGNISGQNNETNNWIFGEYADLNFTEPSSPLSTQNSAMLATAGSASISDVDGNLLFYTNSEMVWDKNNNTMVNGSGLFGNVSADQNSIIVPISGINNLYYLFTIGAQGLFYSKIDTSLNNGLGEVIALNVPLLPALGVGKISAVHHADGESIWVTTTKLNEANEYTSFYTYKVLANGNIETPIINDNLFFKGVPEGIMKYSPNGEKLAITNILPTSINNHLFRFKFNPETGQLTNKVSILTTFEFFSVVSAYGIEFSNDSNRLYASLMKQGFINSSDNGNLAEDSLKNVLLYKYDVTSFTANASPSFLLHQQLGDLIPASLQLAKNGKIYRALSENENEGISFLGVIDSPNLSGPFSSYNHEDLNLQQKKSRLGLPNFIQSYFRTRILNENICNGEFIDYEIDTYAEITAAQWDFGDGNISNEITPNHAYDDAGNYEISVTITVNNREITTSKIINVYGVPNLLTNQELIQCDSDTDGISLFNLTDIKFKITDPSLNEELVFYESIEDAEENLNIIANYNSYTNIVQNQEIYVRVINANGCFSITSFTLNASFIDVINIPNFYSCENSDGIIGDESAVFNIADIRTEIELLLELTDATSLKFYPSLVDAQTTHNLIRTTLTSESTTIWIRLEANDASCGGIAPVNLIVNSTPIINLNDTYTFCGDSPIILYGDTTNDRLEWLDADGLVLSNSNQFSTSISGTYTHVAYIIENGLECYVSKTFTLIENEPPFFEDINVILDYDNNTISMRIGGNSDYEFSLDNLNFVGNSNNFTFNNLPSGTQTVYVRNITQCEATISKTFHLIGYPKFITPNNDGINDFWKIKGADENNLETIRIYDRYGKIIITLNQRNGYRWDGRINDILMPTTDYWFKVFFTDGQNTTGHFTVKN
ncbi:T9SS type B sorting domain-containing protein [Winogradskyella wichelsiae]|uniref:T9SS type B sorting domain-containing protein n=1 Tax=Winogradskyella wichelsiae TaxID=2697007 RepID=UPI003EF4107E